MISIEAGISSSSVLLNISFVHSSSGILTTVVQSSSMLAIMCSLISLAASLALVRFHRAQTDVSASEAASHHYCESVFTHGLLQGDYLETWFHKTLGLQPLAVAYCLPWAFCTWSFIFVAISVVGLSFQ